MSYDGALDPLGASQVVRYLVALAEKGNEIALVSFEKAERWAHEDQRERLRAHLQAAGIVWRPLRYHRTPRIPATFQDMLTGALAIRRLAWEFRPRIVHCRGDVAMAMARWSRPAPEARLLYDVRGLFSQERAEAGSWAREGMLDRLVQRFEANNLRAATGVVILTHAARAALAERGHPLPPSRVIPTCVDTELFHPRQQGIEADYGLVYAGSLGLFYMTVELVAFARAAAATLGRALFLTPQTELVRRLVTDEDDVEVLSAEPMEVPAYVRRARAGFFFCWPGPARRASFPTKFAEALASGLPVVANRGVGDLDDIVEKERVGLLVSSHTSGAYQSALQRLSSLLADPSTPNRCRRLAESRYSLAVGVSAYQDLYEELGHSVPRG